MKGFGFRVFGKYLWRGLPLFWVVLLLNVSCAKRANHIPVSVAAGKVGEDYQSSLNGSQTTTLSAAIAAIRVMGAPDGAHEEIWSALKTQLENALTARGMDKFPSKPPTADQGNSITITPTAGGFTWYEARWGDWTNDGTVTAADLGPLASHFGDSSNPTSPDYWIYAGSIDANGDGSVGAADLSAIAFHFGESTSEYRIYESPNPDGSGAILSATIIRPTPPPDAGNPPWNVSLAPILYNTSTIIPPWAPQQGMYYRVVPTDAQGNESADVSSTFTEYPLSQFPVAVATGIPMDGTPPLNVNFSAAGSNDPDGIIILYEWDFTTDGTYDFSDPNTGDTQFTYNNAGGYTATLRVTDNDGGTGTDTVAITVNPVGTQPPVAVANANPTSGTAPLIVNFSATGSSDPDGFIVLYEWDYNNDTIYDFNSAITGDTQFTYNSPGNYTATLRITDDDGLSDTTAVNITVTSPNLPPIPSPSATPDTGTAPLLVNLSASGSTDPDGIIILYEWDYEGDGTYDWNSPTTGETQHTYNTAGNFFPALRVTDNGGASVSASTIVTVLPPNQQPSAVANADRTSGDAPLLVNFSATGSSDPDGSIVLYEWDFEGDGTYDFSDPGSGATSHTFTIPGLYWPTLRVTDNIGSTDTDSLPIEALGWTLEVADSIGNVGGYTSLAFDFSGNPSVSYYDYDNLDLKFARWFGSGWSTETVDSTGNVGRFTSLAFDPSGNPAISYNDASGFLKFARWNGTIWNVETVDSSGTIDDYTSLAFDPSGNPAISYYDLGNSDLKFAHWNGTTWDIEIVDSVDSVGDYNSLAFDPSGNPAISYFDDGTGDLKFARWNGTTWNKETVDSTGNTGWWTSLAFDSSGNPAISCFEFDNRDLHYAHWNGTTWDIQTVDSTGDVGRQSSLSMDSLGSPAISYRDETNSNLKFARWIGASWDIVTVDSSADVGNHTSLAFDASGNAFISYYNVTDGDMKLARGFIP